MPRSTPASPIFFPSRSTRASARCVTANCSPSSAGGRVRYPPRAPGSRVFFPRPVDARECLARCRNLLTLRRQQLALEDRRRLLEHMVEDATREVREREKETLLRLARAGEFRDEETGYH